MRPLLLLRPEPGLSVSAERARAMGLEVIERPLFAVETLDWELPSVAKFDGLLLTSANAVLRAGTQLEALTQLPAHAVGARTAEAARRAGLNVVSEGEGGVDSLLDSLPAGQRLLHLSGADRITPQSTAHHVISVAVYRAAAFDDPGLPALAGKVVAVHSPRAGRRLAELAGANSQAAIAAISAAAAAACGSGWGEVAVADTPSDPALLALAARLCQGSGAP